MAAERSDEDWDALLDVLRRHVDDCGGTLARDVELLRRLDPAAAEQVEKHR